MNYCQFRNTLIDLDDCRNNLHDWVSPEESLAREKLIMVAGHILRDVGYEMDLRKLHSIAVGFVKTLR